MTLSEKYRPKSLAEVGGSRRPITLPEGVIIFQLQSDPPAGFAFPVKRAFMTILTRPVRRVTTATWAGRSRPKETGETMITVCAWCGREMFRDGTLTPADLRQSWTHKITSTPADVSHGICRECDEEQRHKEGLKPRND